MNTIMFLIRYLIYLTMQQIDPFPNPLFDNNVFVNKHKCILVFTVFYYYLFILFYILGICLKCHSYFTDGICKNKIALKKAILIFI